MDLSSIKDAFARTIKKQKLSSNKTHELIDQVGQVIGQALNELQLPDNDAGSTQKTILADLRRKLDEKAPINQMEGFQKDLASALGKYSKILEKHFNLDISKTYMNIDWDIFTVNQIIAGHFYRQGMTEVGDSFIKEANELGATTELRSQFFQMHHILGAMRSWNLGPALDWAAREREHLLQNGSNVELKLHSLRFLQLLQNSKRNDALPYARVHMSAFASKYAAEFQKLMACLLWPGRLDQSPYAELMSPSRWEELAVEIARQFCNKLGQAYGSPLSTVVAAGFQALPTMLKMASAVAATNHDWQGMKQLPLPVDLGREFQFHSIFVCPVSWDQSTEENPPMLMPCGHVLCKQTLVKLSKSSNRLFKCPYCPFDTTITQCRQLYF